jgi:Clostripain family
MLPDITATRSSSCSGARSPARADACTPRPLSMPSEVAPQDQATVGSSTPTQPPHRKAWTVLVYAAGDNNLYPYELQNLKDIEKVGSTHELNVVAQFDAGASGSTTRMLMKRCTTSDGSLGSPVLEDLGQVDMASPKTLADFLVWGETHYPAEHYMLVVNDHGGGWTGCVQDASAHDWMTLPHLQQALQGAQAVTGNELDVLGFDACLMGMAEVGHELKDDAHFMVASQETEGAAGWPYSTLLTSKLLEHMDATLSKRLPLDPQALAQAAVLKAGDHPDDLPTMAAYDLSQEPVLKAAIDGLTAALSAARLPLAFYQSVKRSSQAFSMNGFRDLYDVCSAIKASPESTAELKAAADTCQQAVSALVLAETHSPSFPGAHGVSIETDPGHSGYSKLSFAHDTAWTTIQRKFGRVGQAEQAPAEAPLKPAE